MIRDPVVAGQFYPFSKETLWEELEKLIPKKVEKREVLGAVSPHAGYPYSGKVAALTLSKIKSADTFVILGPNHSGWGEDFAMVKEGVWKTPLGEIKIDSILAKEILINSPLLKEDPLAHEREHSIEVQLPFLQALFKDFQLVPIAVKHYLPDENFLNYCQEVGEGMAKAIKKLKEKVVIIASSDLTHYEPQEIAKKKDKHALDAILELNPEKLFQEIKNQNISACGYAPIAIMLTCCKKLGAKNSELVSYMTSGDTTGDFSQVVGYGGVIIF